MAAAMTEPASTPAPIAPLDGMAGGLRAALMLLTRLPAGTHLSPGALRWGSGWFPVVGAIVGGITAALLTLLAGPLPPAMAAFVVIIVSLLVTGALHEDGLADTADALGGARDRDSIFVILKDSRHGTYGVAALVTALGLRAAALATTVDFPAAIVIAAIVSRTTLTALLVALPYVTPDDVARSRTVVHARVPQLILALAFTAAAFALALARGWLTPLGTGVVVGAGVLVATVAGWRFSARAGGITGDFLGATQQVVELASLCALVALGGR